MFRCCPDYEPTVDESVHEGGDRRAADIVRCVSADNDASSPSTSSNVTDSPRVAWSVAARSITTHGDVVDAVSRECAS
jgi:hypothetical protein